MQNYRNYEWDWLVLAKKNLAIFTPGALRRGLATPRVQAEARWHGSGGQRPIQSCTRGMDPRDLVAVIKENSENISANQNSTEIRT